MSIKMLLNCALAMVLVVLTSCNDGPRTEITHRRALIWETVYEAEIIKVWDTMHLNRAVDPHVSHYIEVLILTEGDDLTGQQIGFPYDEWSVGKKPPSVGEVVLFTPASWVQTSASSMGRPKSGW